MGDLTKNFSRDEFACKSGSGLDAISLELVDVMQSIRDHFGRRIVVNSGCRTPEYNKAIGGAKFSKHLPQANGECIACDFVVDGVSPNEVQEYLLERFAGLPGGIGRYNTFTHIDVRKNVSARWDKRSK